MIYNYEIKHENNEEVLYLYLDISDEFAKKDITKFNFKKYIKNFIKKKNIIFLGVSAVIVVGGVSIGRINLDNLDSSNMNNIKICDIVNLNKESIYNQIANEIVENNTQEIEKKEDNKSIIINSNKNNTPVKTKITKSTIKTKNTQVPKTNAKKAKTTKKTETTELKQEKNISDKKSEELINVYRSNGDVLSIELEEYVIGVVGAEMPASFHKEALKAQAVIARTYAMNAIKNNLKLTDNSSTQNYKSNAELKKIWGSDYSKYYQKIKSAVMETKGEYLTYDGEVIEALYHSTSNGQTEDAMFVWGNEKPYLKSVESPYDKLNPSFIKESFFTYEEVSKRLKDVITSASDIEVLSYTSGHRINILKINDQTLTGVEIRSIFGLRSADFQIKKEEKGILFTTSGYGHGVGLSQYGANGYAKSGFTYKEILYHYYTGVKLIKT